MRHLKFTAAAAAVVMAASAMTAFSSWAADTEVLYIDPVYEDFNPNISNGTIFIMLPEELTAKVLITFDSPELTGGTYHSAALDKPGTYGFEIEGHDNTDSDYFRYTLSVQFTDSKGIDCGEPYIEEFSVPDPDDNPESFTDFTYKLVASHEESGSSWSITNNYGSTKEITVFIKDGEMGDVNGDGAVDAADASAVLQEYALLSTGGTPTFTDLQGKLADVNKDGSIDASDASAILKFYSINSTGGTAVWDEIV